MTIPCQSSPSCRIALGQRHLPTCPRHGATSGPSGKGLQPRSNVDSIKLAMLRMLLGLGVDTTPNDTLDAAIVALTPIKKPLK